MRSAFGCRLLFVVRRLSFVVCRLSFVVCRRSFVPKFVRSFRSSFVRSEVRSFVPKFRSSFVRSEVRSFVPKFVRSFGNVDVVAVVVVVVAHKLILILFQAMFHKLILIRKLPILPSILSCRRWLLPRPLIHCPLYWRDSRVVFCCARCLAARLMVYCGVACSIVVLFFECFRWRGHAEGAPQASIRADPIANLSVTCDFLTRHRLCSGR